MNEAVRVRFWAKADKAGPLPDHRPDLGPCWDWTGAVDKRSGYGRFRIEGRTRQAYKVAWWLEVGTVPDGLDLDHLCRRRICVRPSHLEPATRSQNIRRGARSIRFLGRCRSGRHIIASEVDIHFRGDRSLGCLACHREYRERYNERRRKR
jgi:hypothetical protein